MLWIAMISLLTPAWCMAAAGTPLGVFPINEESLAQMQKRHPLGSVEVDDPVYKRKQRYQGFWLRDLLKDLSYAGHPESDVYVRFRCKDGYAPIMPLSRALRGEGLIAVRDLGAPPGKNWEPFSANGETSRPATDRGASKVRVMDGCPSAATTHAVVVSPSTAEKGRSAGSRPPGPASVANDPEADSRSKPE